MRESVVSRPPRSPVPGAFGHGGCAPAAASLEPGSLRGPGPAPGCGRSSTRDGGVADGGQRSQVSVPAARGSARRRLPAALSPPLRGECSPRGPRGRLVGPGLKPLSLPPRGLMELPRSGWPCWCGTVRTAGAVNGRRVPPAAGPKGLPLLLRHRCRCWLSAGWCFRPGVPLTGRPGNGSA